MADLTYSEYVDRCFEEMKKSDNLTAKKKDFGIFKVIHIEYAGKYSETLESSKHYSKAVAVLDKYNEKIKRQKKKKSES